MAEPNLPETGTRKSPSPPPINRPGVAPTGEWVPADAPGVQLAVPPRIGRFEVRAVLGTGSYGRVFLAFDPEMGRQVAIKQPFGEGLRPEYREDFIKEARAAAVIDQHANVCPVYHIDTDAGLPYIVMRFVAGGTLKNLLERRAELLPVRKALLIARKIALGLSAAHAKGVIHRDLKPANVLIDEANGEVLITDFGLARIASRTQAAASLQRGAHGTPYYMPPEQWGSQAFGPISPLADVYSLGVILYEMLAGRVPFTGAPFELMTRHCAEPPRPPSGLRRGLDPRLDAICLKMLEKMPANRYRSAREFADVATDYLRGGDIDLAQALPLGEPIEESSALPIGEPIEEPAAKPSPPRPVPDWARPVAGPPPLPNRPGTSPASASTASLPDATIDEKEVVRCPKCSARLEIVRSRTRPIDCPMCALKFAVEAGRQAAARGAGGKEKDKPPAEPPRRRRDREAWREDRRPRPRDEDEIPYRHWQPAARGLRLIWIGMLLIAAFTFGLAAAAIASVSAGPSSSSSGSSTTYSEKGSEYSSTTGNSSRDPQYTAFHVAYTLLGLGITSGLVVMSLGRFFAARLPAGVRGGNSATLSAAAGWLAAVCVAVPFLLIGWLLEEPGPGNETLERAAAIAGGAGVLLLLGGEFAFNRYLGGIRRDIPGFPRELLNVATGLFWLIFSAVVIGAGAGGVAAALDEVKYKQGVGVAAIMAGGAACISLGLFPFWGFVTLWLNIHAAVVVGRHASGER